MQVERVAGADESHRRSLDTAKMLFRGQLSLDFVSALKAQNETAVGLSGADGSMIQAVKEDRNIIEDDHGEMIQVDFGEVGDVCSSRYQGLTEELGSQCDSRREPFGHG